MDENGVEDVSVIQTALFLFVMAIMSGLQIKVILRKGEKREVAVYALLSLSAMVVGTLLLFDVRLLSPTVPLRAVFEPFDRWLFG